MKSYPRSERVADLIRREVAQLLVRDIHDPRLQFVSITEVSVTPDLREATVFFTLLDSVSVEEVEKTLNKAVGHFKRQLAAALTLRHLPQLSFRYDAVLARATQLSELIDGL